MIIACKQLVISFQLNLILYGLQSFSFFLNATVRTFFSRWLYQWTWAPARASLSWIKAVRRTSCHGERCYVSCCSSEIQTITQIVKLTTINVKVCMKPARSLEPEFDWLILYTGSDAWSLEDWHLGVWMRDKWATSRLAFYIIIAPEMRPKETWFARSSLLQYL